MANKSRLVDRLLFDLGKAMGMNELYFDDNDGCLLQFDDTITVLILYQHEKEQLYFFSYVGEIPIEHEVKVLSRALEANYRWDETLGATLSIRPGENDLVVTNSLHVSFLDIVSLQNELSNFVMVVEQWTNYLQDPEKNLVGKDKEAAKKVEIEKTPPPSSASIRA